MGVKNELKPHCRGSTLKFGNGMETSEQADIESTDAENLVAEDKT